jgi:hypothetical protein
MRGETLLAAVELEAFRYRRFPHEQFPALPGRYSRL